MAIESAMRDFLLADAGVAALVAARGYQLRFPQSPTYPAFRVLLVDDPAQYTHDGPNELRQATVQIDAVTQESSGADPYENVLALTDAIDGAASGYRGSMGSESPAVTVQGVFRTGRIPTYDPDELRVVRMILTYQVWYLTTA